MDEAAAIEGLRRSEEKLRAYAEERGLAVRTETPYPGALPPEQQRGPVRHAVWSLAGRLPGGAIGRLRHQAVFGETFGMKVAGQHTIMVCRLPETVGYVPMLCCRPDELGMGTYYWGGDQRPRESAKFESAELDRRYVIDIAKGQDQNWLFQLFSPTLIDWIAHETPPDFGFKLASGVFTCEVPQWRGQARRDGEVDAEHLDLLASAGGRVAGRLRDEVLEEVGLFDAPDAPSATAHGAWSTAPSHGRIVGTLLKLVGGGKDDSVARFAAERGMQVEDPAAFHARLIRLPLPGTASDVVTGTLPGTERPGTIAWLEFSSDVDMQHNYIAVVVETAAEQPLTWVDADDVTVPGFGEGLPDPVLAAAREGGFGISTADRAACLYFRAPGFSTWPSGEEVDAFAAKAAGILAGLG